MKTHCKICGEEFTTYPCEIKKGWGKYCSRACMGKARQGKRRTLRPVMTCLQCGKQFEIKPFELKQGRGKYCSMECMGLSRLGRAPELHGSWKGGKEKRACKVCGIKFWCYPANPKKYCGVACRNSDPDYRAQFTGENNPLWAGGNKQGRQHQMQLKEYRDWRKEVFARDGYKCQDCGDKRGGNLNAHHLFLWRDFPEVRYEVWNGTTLCEDCHKTRHYAAVA